MTNVMRWFKSKSYWLKGGIVGTILFVFSSLLSIFCLSTTAGEHSMSCVFIPAFFVGWWFWEIVTTNPDFFVLEDIFYSIFGNSEMSWIIATHVTSLIIFFVAGAIIGWVVGKIKR